MKAAVFVLLLGFYLASWAQDEDAPYSISADKVYMDNGVTIYEGHARAEILNVVIEAETIAVTGEDSTPARIEASGNPLKFRQRASSDSLSGTARQLIFSVPELKLTLIDYAVADAAGNSMKGKRASFVLSP